MGKRHLHYLLLTNAGCGSTFVGFVLFSFIYFFIHRCIFEILFSLPFVLFRCYGGKSLFFFKFFHILFLYLSLLLYVFFFVCVCDELLPNCFVMKLDSTFVFLIRHPFLFLLVGEVCTGWDCPTYSSLHSMKEIQWVNIFLLVFICRQLYVDMTWHGKYPSLLGCLCLILFLFSYALKDWLYFDSVSLHCTHFSFFSNLLMYGQLLYGSNSIEDDYCLLILQYMNCWNIHFTSPSFILISICFVFIFRLYVFG